MTGTVVPLTAYLTLAALLFGIGLFGVMRRRNLVLFLLSVEVMMNAGNLSLVAFWRYGVVDLSGPMLAMFAIVIAGAESAVGLALVIAIFRHNKSASSNDLTSMRG